MSASHQRNVYLKMTPLSEARQLLADRFDGRGVLGTETVATVDAVDRVLAAPVTALVSAPNFHAAAMDGVAVTADTTYGAHETSPVTLDIGSTAHWVNTGHVMPPGTDAVIMIEHLIQLDDGRIRIEAPVFPWQHVRKMGEDIVATELLFARHHRVTPYCLGALLAGGVFDVPVFKRPRVLIIPTGNELVDWRHVDPRQMAPGQVIESNAYVLGELVKRCGGVFERWDRRSDDLDVIGQAVRAAVAAGVELVMILGGSSAGSMDYSRPVIEAHGELLIHGVTMMPGKPVIAGRIGDTPVFGMPGYPVSAIMAFEQLVAPLLLRLQGLAERPRAKVPVHLTRKLASKLGVEEFVRVKLGQVGERLVATALPRGAGCITSITEADGIVRVGRQQEGLGADQPVQAELLRPLDRIRDTIVAVGSHDNSLDILADELRTGPGHLSLSSSHVGSMGGLMAVKRGVCHLAGTHLLDEADGSYNISFIERFLPEVPVRLVHLVMRDQGLMVAAGNPKQIASLADLARDDVTFINRQAGSGTRILLDFQLGRLGISPDDVSGYGHEEFTHMSVAAAVLSGAADAGLGIFAAARALGLDFIPVVTEQYDLLMPKAVFDTAPIQQLLDTIATKRFQERVRALGGYHTERTGDIVYG